MDNVLHSLKKKLGKIANNAFEAFDSEDPLIVLPYRGYANSENIFLKGRVLEDENIFHGKSESEIRNIINSFKRFETDELPDATVQIDINNQSFEVKSDEEGYFILDTAWKSPEKEPESQWLEVDLKLLLNSDEDSPSVQAKGEIFYPSSNADYGVITDVDDTVLQTHVTSMFRLKMIYATFFQDAHQRLPMEGMVEVFQSFVKGGNGKRTNPIFYVSNSPWNLYDLLEEFFQVQQFPKGPILLRDYGFRPSGEHEGHKISAISHLLKTYSNLPFILLGDTASKDTDFYLQLARNFPNQIKAIYIRQTKNTENARRVAQLIEDNSNINAILIHSSQDIIEHARKASIMHFDRTIS